MAADNDGLKLGGDVVEVGRAAIGRVECSPVQPPPVAMLADAHLAHGRGHVGGLAHKWHSQVLRAIGTADAVAMVAVSQRQVAFVRVDDDPARCQGCSPIAHTARAHAAGEHGGPLQSPLKGGSLVVVTQNFPPLRGD